MHTLPLPELFIKMRPNNQVSIGLQNVCSTRKDIYQHRYIGRERYSSEQDGIIATHKPELSQWQKNLLTARIAEQKLKTARLAKCKKNTNPVSYDFRVAPPLDIIRKFQRKLKMALCVALRFLALRKIVYALTYFSQYRVPKARKFSHIAGQKIRECGAAIDILCNGKPSEARVVTLTLPADNTEAFAALAAYSGYAINRLFQPIRRHFEEISAWFFVWEHQKRGALHLHICIHCGDAKRSQEAGDILVEQWFKVLCDISEQSGVCMFTNKKGNACTIRQFHQNVNQVMEKSCGAYFSKYAGKASQSEENSYVHRFAQIYPPTRFWGSSKVVKNLIKENSFSFNLEENPIEIEEKFNSIRELLLEEEIVSFNEYDWDIQIRKVNKAVRKPDISPLSKPKKYLSVETLTVSSGFCQVFYFPPPIYKKLLSLIPTTVSTFGDF